MKASIQQFADMIGVIPDTIRRWERAGIITPERTMGGHRRYTEKELHQVLQIKRPEAIQRRNVIYCRVSSPSQKDDLQSQIETMQMFATEQGIVAETISEIGGGMNMSRPKFMSIINAIIRGEVETLIVAHKDRLARFGFELIENIAELHGCKIIVANCEKLSPQAEMVEDLMSIIHTFSCRLYGLRRYKKAKDLIEDETNA